MTPEKHQPQYLDRREFKPRTHNLPATHLHLWLTQPGEAQFNRALEKLPRTKKANPVKGWLFLVLLLSYLEDF